MHSFVLTPNCSLTTRSALVFFLGIATVSLTVAVGFALAGYWPILPFAGLELLALAVALRWSMRQGRRRELIRVEAGRVLVSKSGRRGQLEYEFPRPWTRVELLESNATNWPRRLVLRSKGRVVEVGRFLTDSERVSLGKRLAEVIPGLPGRQTLATAAQQGGQSKESE